MNNPHKMRIIMPIEFDGFKAIGYYPYESASIDITNKVCCPRHVYSEIENTIREKANIQDNKWIVIFEDTTRFGTDNFAIFFKDCFAVIGKWKDIQPYGGYKEIK